MYTVCVCTYLLYVLLQLVLSTGLSSRRFLNNLSRSPDFFVCVGSQKNTFIKISHREHVLFIFPVNGFTVGNTKLQSNTVRSEEVLKVSFPDPGQLTCYQ